MSIFTNKFDENLLNSSFNEENLEKSLEEVLEEAKKQWVFFDSDNCEDKKTCICGHKIKKVEYFFNNINGNIICCGTTCCKKFNFKTEKMSNELLSNILKLKKKYNEYNHFNNIHEYLVNSKDELDKFIEKKIEKSNFNNLIILLENLNNINKNYGLTIFDIYITSIKTKISDLIPSYIEEELKKDFECIFDLMKKFGKLFIDFQIEKPETKLFESIIGNIVENNIINYSGYTTPGLQYKIEQVLEKIDKIKEKIGKTLLIKNCLILMNTKLKDKIQKVRDYNFQCEKRKYEDKKKREENIRRKYPHRYPNF